MKANKITPHKGNRNKRISVRATEATKARLDRIAQETGLSQADVLERLIMHYGAYVAIADDEAPK